MKQYFFILAALFLSAPFATAQWSTPTPANIGLPTGQDLIMDKVAFPAFNRLGHLESGIYGDPSSKWAAIGVPNLNFPPFEPDYYGFFANNQSDRLFVGLRQEGPFNVSNAIIAFGDNHDNDPVPNRMVFKFDSWVPSFSREIATMLANGNVGIGIAAPTQRLHVSGGNALLDYSTGSTTGNLYFGGLTTSNQNGMRLSYFNSAGTGTFKNGYIDVRTIGGTANDGLIFRIDNTTAAGTERMRICANGNVGINNAAPAAKLHVSTATANDGIRVNQTGTTAATLSLAATGTGAKNYSLRSTGPGSTEGAGHLLFWDGTATPEKMRITSAGDVGIGATSNPGTYRLFVGGSVHISGALFAASDRRFKQNIQTLDGALATINRLRGVQYTYRQGEFADRNFPAGKTDGFIAQELREVLPELVQEGTDGYLAVNYQGVIPVLTEAVKELKAEKDQEISELQTQLAEKDRQISALEARLARLEAAFDRTAVPAASQPDYQLSNKPNPFSGTTIVTCTIPETVKNAELVVTDLAGREIARRPVTGRGEASIELNLSTTPNGTYLCTLLADGQAAGTLKLAVNGR